MKNIYEAICDSIYKITGEYYGKGNFTYKPTKLILNHKAKHALFDYVVKNNNLTSLCGIDFKYFLGIPIIIRDFNEDYTDWRIE